MPVAPAAPTGLTATVAAISGHAEASSTVKVYKSTGNAGDNGPASTLIGTVTATAGGTFSYTVTAGDNVSVGDIVTATAENAGGPSGPAVNVAVTPVTPAAPTGLTATVATIAGNAEASSTVKVYKSTGNAGDNGPASTLIGTVTATAGGTFSYTVTAGDNVVAGTIVTATATNAGGTSGPAANVTVLPLAPVAPSSLVASTATVTGNAEAASTVKLYKSSGSAGGNGPGDTLIATVTATAGGSFSWPVSPAGTLVPGDIVTATATNAGGTSRLRGQRRHHERRDPACRNRQLHPDHHERLGLGDDGRGLLALQQRDGLRRRRIGRHDAPGRRHHA